MGRRFYAASLVLFAGAFLCSCEKGEQKAMVEESWPVWDVVFSPDGSLLAAGRGYRDNWKFWPAGGEGKVNVWSTANWKNQSGFSAPFTYMAQAIVFTPDGKSLLAASNKYKRIDPKVKQSRGRDIWGRQIAGAPSPWDGNVIFTWTVSDCSLADTLAFNDFHIPGRGAGSVVSMTLSPGGELLGLGRTGSISVVLNRKTGRSVYELWNNGKEHSLVFSPSGKPLISIIRLTLVHLFDSTTGMEMAQFDLKNAEPNCAQFSPDGDQVAVGASDGTVRVLTSDLTKQLSSLKISDEKEKVVAVAYAAKADLLVAASRSKVRLFAARSGKRVRDWGKTNLEVRTVALSPDGKLLAVGYGGIHEAPGEKRSGFINVWDTASGELIKKLK
jgi:WD40 repeat protein